MEKTVTKLTKYGMKEMTGHIIGPLIVALIFFIISGTIDLPRAWIWTVLNLAYYTAGMLLLYFISPVLLNERGNWSIKKDAKKWDRILLQIFGTVGLYGHTALMALTRAGSNGQSWKGGPFTRASYCLLLVFL